MFLGDSIFFSYSEKRPRLPILPSYAAGDLASLLKHMPVTGKLCIIPISFHASVLETEREAGQTIEL